ncbi:thiamine pyrophosphate-dependent enzyme, partial [Rhizobium ruizarguesonis]
IMPQHALERLHALTKPHDPIIATEICEQMWVAQFFGFDRPNRWITSGGLGTMGFGLPAAGLNGFCCLGCSIIRRHCGWASASLAT